MLTEKILQASIMGKIISHEQKSVFGRGAYTQHVAGVSCAEGLLTTKQSVYNRI